MVLGSKNNHYTITLKDDKHTCTCLDYREWGWGYGPCCICRRRS